MVNRLFFAVCLFAISTTSFATDQCTKGTEFEPPLCPLKLPKIIKITIQENAAKSPADKDSSVACASFFIKKAQVRRYFANAKTTNENDVHHTLDWSPCYASGEVFFSDGRFGHWSLSQLRVGSLSINDEEKIILYCPRCKFRPFQ